MKNDKNLEKDRIEYVYQEYLSNKKVLKKWSNKNIGNQISLEERHNIVKGFFIKNNFDIKNNKIIDLGCAGGNFTGTLLDIGARKKNITGIDIRKNSIKNAVKSFPGICFKLMDARQLKFPKNSFDCIFIFTLFSSVLDSNDRKRIAIEAKRVLKSNGLIIYYDLRFYNPFNRNIIGLNKKEIFRIFPGMEIEYSKTTLIPPIARNLGIITSILYPVLTKISFLKSHFLCVIKKK